jgi:hypothetical protein
MDIRVSPARERPGRRSIQYPGMPSSYVVKLGGFPARSINGADRATPPVCSGPEVGPTMNIDGAFSHFKISGVLGNRGTRLLPGYLYYNGMCSFCVNFITCIWTVDRLCTFLSLQ